MKQSICAIICAAGKGTRAGFEQNKVLVPLNGKRVLEWTLSAFDFSLIDEILVTASVDDMQKITDLCSPFPKAKVVLGGATRSESVYNALREAQADIVLIHDGARPFVSREVIENCVQSVKAYGSGICAIPCLDTVAVVENDKIKAVPDRNTLFQVQTPQGFFRENILFAYQRAFENEEVNYTDDSSVFKAYCGQPRVCAGARENIKLTHARDFAQNTVRCGFGIDTHAFGKAQDYILLAGVKIPAKSGLIAHSDGDVLCHAVMDALLSSAGMRDIGFYFPDNNANYKDANSMELLKQVIDMLAKQGYKVKNISVAVQAETPRLAGYIESMQNALASVLQIDPTAVGISAGTNEGLGYVGEGKGITVHAYALIENK